MLLLDNNLYNVISNPSISEIVSAIYNVSIILVLMGLVAIVLMKRLNHDDKQLFLCVEVATLFSTLIVFFTGAPIKMMWHSKKLLFSMKILIVSVLVNIMMLAWAIHQAK